MKNRPFFILLILSLLSGALAACTEPPPPTPVSTSAHIQCFSEGQMVFDQQFDHAETLADGQIQVWLGAESVALEGDCQIVD